MLPDIGVKSCVWPDMLIVEHEQWGKRENDDR
jgi:hypothetical protein